MKFQQNSESFPEFHIPALEREARKWAKIYPEIRRVTLYACHDPERYGFKYIIIWDVTQIPKELSSPIEFSLKQEKLLSGAFVECYKNSPNHGYYKDWAIEISLLNDQAPSQEPGEHKLHEEKEINASSDQGFVTIIDHYLENPKIVLYDIDNPHDLLTSDVPNTASGLKQEDTLEKETDQSQEPPAEHLEATYRTVVKADDSLTNDVPNTASGLKQEDTLEKETDQSQESLAEHLGATYRTVVKDSESLINDVSNTECSVQEGDNFENRLDRLLVDMIKPIEAIWLYLKEEKISKSWYDEHPENLHQNALTGLKKYIQAGNKPIIRKEDIDNRSLCSFNADGYPKRRFIGKLIKRVLRREFPSMKTPNYQALYDRYKKLGKELA